MTTQPTPPSPPLEPKDLLVVLQELGTALRARSDPEHIYTAAAVGYFGAVAWGVAALKPQDYLSRVIWTRPATVAAVGILVVACLVVWKILHEHKNFATIKEQYARVAAILKALPNGDVIPDQLTKRAGKGAWISVCIVIGAALPSIAFCLFLGWQL